MPRKLIARHSFPAFGTNAPGSVVLHDQGPGERMRYVTHWRNDGDGGTGYGNYFATLKEGLDDFRRRVLEKTADLGRDKPGSEPKGPFVVDLWGSPREEGNDDHWTRDEAPTLELALSHLERVTSTPRLGYWVHAYLDAASGPLLHMVNPSPKVDNDDDLDRSEAAGLAGMAHGVAGRNEVLGEDVDDAPYGYR